MPDAKFLEEMGRVATLLASDTQENQLSLYKPVSEQALQIHLSEASVIGVGGGNGSSKTETSLVELLMCATGIIPDALWDVVDVEKKWRGPMQCRIVLESLTNVLNNVMLRKLKWWEWTGEGMPGTKKGHWGWIPKTSLIDGSWDKSWKAQDRTLSFYCRNPWHPEKIEGRSTIQFMSHDTDPSDAASGDLHIVLLDEPPKYAMWRESQARTMRGAGRIILAMTWPDDPTINVDWIYDEIYEPAQADPEGDIQWYELWTENNPHLNQESIAKQRAKWSKEIAAVRLRGQPIRFSNRIHPLFTDIEQHWCFSCNATTLPTGEGLCPECRGEDVVAFNHVDEVLHPVSRYPAILLMDPHPRKPHDWCYAQVDPYDDVRIVHCDELDAAPGEVVERCEAFEREWALPVALRLMDPNMGLSQSQAGRDRDKTWQGEFADAGMYFDLADDSSVGRKTLDAWLKPDPHTRRPRFAIASRCEKAIRQMKRYVWDNYKDSMDRDVKQTPKPKNDDLPTLFKYLANNQPSFRLLRDGGTIIHAGRRARR